MRVKIMVKQLDKRPHCRITAKYEKYSKVPLFPRTIYSLVLDALKPIALGVGQCISLEIEIENSGQLVDPDFTNKK